MKTFSFHGWLIVEVESDEGLVGIGNAALAPLVTKQVIDQYLAPLLVGENPWDVEFLWQHMYRNTMAFGRKGIGMTAISAVDIALWDLLEKRPGNPSTGCLEGERNSVSRCMRAVCIPLRLKSSRQKRVVIKRRATKR